MSLTVLQLRNLSPRDYLVEVKLRLRDDMAWVEMLDPSLLGRTMMALDRIVSSLDEQLERGRRQHPVDIPWIRSMETLRRLVVRRQEGLRHGSTTAVSDSRQARAWRGLAARLASIIEDQAPYLLDGITIPQSDLPVTEWLAERRAKGSEQ